MGSIGRKREILREKREREKENKDKRTESNAVNRLNYKDR